MKRIILLLSVATCAALVVACQGTTEENNARNLSSYYAQKGEQMNPTAKKVDQRNPPPNATPTPPTQAAPAPGRN